MSAFCLLVRIQFPIFRLPCLFVSPSPRTTNTPPQVLLADNLFIDMAGVFEYDFELKEKGEHRKFLTQTASFKQVGAPTEWLFTYQVSIM